MGAAYLSRLNCGNERIMSAARIIFPSIEAAKRQTPYFIDEEGVGIWLSTSDAHLLTQTSIVSLMRDAIHIPSVTKTGQILADSLIAKFVQRANAIGLSRVNKAVGYWTLSETGQLQAEAVKIAFSMASCDRQKLEALAHFILVRANQDAVAWEAGGEVKHLYANNL